MKNSRQTQKFMVLTVLFVLAAPPVWAGGDFNFGVGYTSNAKHGRHGKRGYKQGKTGRKHAKRGHGHQKHGRKHGKHGYGHQKHGRYPKYKHGHRFSFHSGYYREPFYKFYQDPFYRPYLKSQYKHHYRKHNRPYKRHHQHGYHRHIDELPFFAKKIYVNDHYYYHDDGIFYTRCGGGYDIVRGPIGSRLHRLPFGYETYKHHGEKYFVYRDTHYRRGSKGYIVIDTPDFYVSYKRW